MKNQGITITYYLKSEVLQIQFGQDPTSYLYDLDEKESKTKLISQLLRIIDSKQKVKIIKKVNNK